MTSSEIRKNARTSLAGKWGKGVLITIAYAVVMWLFGFITGLVGEGSVLQTVLELIVFIISVPLSLGLVFTFMKLKRGEEVGAFDFFKLGFSNFGKSWRLYGSQIVKLIVPVICVIVSVVIMVVGLFTFLGNSISPDNLNTLNSLLETSNQTGLENYFASVTFGSSTLLLVGFILWIVSSIYLYIKGLSLSVTFNIAYDEPELTGMQTASKSQELMKGHKGGYFILTLSFIGWAILSVLTLGIGFLWLLPYMQVSFVCFYDALVGKTTEKPVEEKPVETPAE